MALVCYIISHLKKDGGSMTKTVSVPFKGQKYKATFRERYKEPCQCDLWNLIDLS